MSFTNILVCELFDVWGLISHDKYIFLVVGYESKWVAHVGPRTLGGDQIFKEKYFC